MTNKINIPVGTQVSRCSGRIYDRNNESDIDITDNEELVYKLYARKQGTYFVNRVFPEWGMDVLRPDLIERARKMTRARTKKEISEHIKIDIRFKRNPMAWTKYSLCHRVVFV